MIGSSRVMRTLGLGFLAFSGLTCSLQDAPTGPGSPAVAGFQVSPVLPPSFSRFAVGLGIERVHLVLQSHRSTVLEDTIIPFAPTAASLTIRLPILLSSSAESLTVSLSYETLTGTVLFTGQQTILVRPGTATTPPQVPVAYVGPGADVAYLYVTPSDSVISFGDTAYMDVQAYDSLNQLVTGVYISWQTDNPAVSIDAQGRIPAPSQQEAAVVYAQTPNGSQGATVVYFAPGQVAITPDSVELLPGQTLYFGAYGAPFGNTNWTVNGIVGGDSTVGTIDQLYGMYTAPSTVPSPATVSVCASVAADTSCAEVTVASPPSPGGDVIILGDTYLLSDAALGAQPGNRTFATQMVTYGGTGPRVAGRNVIFDRGRSAACLASGLCADSALNSLTNALTTAGYSIQRVDTASVYRNIGAGVKVIVFWNPEVYLSDRETNELKKFARQGGRIIIVADDTTSLGGSQSNALSVAGDMIYRLSSGGLYYSYADVSCGGAADITGPIMPHQSTTGVSAARINCGTELYNSGGGGYPLLISGQQIVGGVIKVDPTPQVTYGG